jgi:hypothetical protein
VLERVGVSRPAGRDDGDERAGARVTDGAVSSRGDWVVLRSNDSLTFYRASDLLDGTWRAASTVEVKSLGEPQGEGVAFGSDDTLYLVGESGGRARGGTFAVLRCSLGR